MERSKTSGDRERGRNGGGRSATIGEHRPELPAIFERARHPRTVTEINAVSIQVVPSVDRTCQRTVGVEVSPGSYEPIPRIWTDRGLSGFGALPVDLKELTHGHLEVVEIRTLAARRDQLGVGADGQA